MKNIESFLNLLTNVKARTNDQWEADCPCLSHKTPAKHLSVALKGDKILLKCFGSDTAEDIVSSLKLEMKDLIIKPDAPEQKIVAEYDYKDEDGKVLFQVVRFVPKDFRQRHKNGGGEWLWNLDGVRRVLYHLPEVNTAIGHGETIYLTEGEKDADNLWNWGIPATTSPGGANNWKTEYADMLKGAHVVIIPDKDAPGFAYARAVANSLEGKARDTKCIILPGDAKDVSDWLNAGGDSQQLPSMVKDISALFEADQVVYQKKDESVVWTKKTAIGSISFTAENITQEKTGIHARISIAHNYVLLGWTYFNIERAEDRTRLANACHAQLKTEEKYDKEALRHDLDAFCKGLWPFYVSQFVPEELVGDETIEPLTFLLKPYIIQGGGTILFAPPGRSKSYTALIWAICIDAGLSSFWPVHQGKVLFINLERSRESLRRRLTMVNKVLGLPATRPLYILNARGKSLSTVMGACQKAVKDNHVDMIVLDSISRAGVGDLNENQSGNKVIDALSALCPTWLALGHTPRADEGHTFGSVMQDAGADICVQLNTELVEDGKVLGCGYQITKQNDMGETLQNVYAYEFDDTGLVVFRAAKKDEFPDIDSKASTNKSNIVKNWILDRNDAKATATQVADTLHIQRTAVTKLFNDPKNGFVKLEKVGRDQYYGVKSSEES